MQRWPLIGWRNMHDFLIAITAVLSLLLAVTVVVAVEGAILLAIAASLIDARKTKTEGTQSDSRTDS